MKRKAKPKKPPTKSSAASRGTATQRVYLSYPPDLIHEPLIYRAGHDFGVVTNIRTATISDDAGLVALELQGEPEEINRALSWFRARGVKVERIDARMVE
jgi:hypothetical protein